VDIKMRKFISFPRCMCNRYLSIFFSTDKYLLFYYY